MSLSTMEDVDTNNTNNGNNNHQLDNLSIFCREVRNLLRSKPNCLIPFSKFVPAYHNHYGRQCCVYQFGFTKLIELLEAIPHVVQIISDDQGNRYITLTHREQIKRFASDLIKVVKSQPGKRLKLSRFAKAYEQVLGRQFRIEDYGTNDINVLLVEIWEGTINIIPIRKELATDVKEPLFVASSAHTQQQQQKQQQQQATGNNILSNMINNSSNHGNSKQPPTKQQIDTQSSPTSITSISTSSSSYPKNPILDQLVAATPLINKPYVTANYPDVWFEIPKRERSEKEIKRTKYFIWDVVELLSKIRPDYSVPFSKFIPSYHYYFNRQCKVSIFGFSKLIDLFESISPDVVEIIDQGPGEEKLIRLAPKYRPSNHNNNNNRSLNGNGNNNVNRTKRRAAAAAAAAAVGATTTVPALAASTGSPTSPNSPTSPEPIDEGPTEEELFELEDEIQAYEQLRAIQSAERQADPIDKGLTEEELLELEDELQAYEELKAIQSKRSMRMAALLDIFKRQAC